MKGVCLHHEAGPLDAAVPNEVWFRRLTELKKIGCNAIRAAHNPPSSEFLDMCDELGFLVMNEFVDKWENPHLREGTNKNPFYNQPFADPNFSVEWQRNFSETIRRDRNHPSLIIWSVGNENPIGFVPKSGSILSNGAVDPGDLAITIPIRFALAMRSA